MAHISDDIVSVIDASTNNLIDTIRVDSIYSDIAVSPDGNRIYLVNDLDSIVSVIDVTTKNVVDTINVGDTPREIVISTYHSASPQRFTLTARKSGSGSGTITSSPPGINCGGDCTEKYDGNTEISLTATPGSGSSFAGWSGDSDCSDGVVKMSTNKTCTATFNLLTFNCDCNHPSAIRGTNGNDILEGTPKADIICGFGGNDTIRGYGGADCIDGGPGKDKIYGGAGDDKLYGGGGRDVIRGAGGKDLLDGGLGIDTLNGGKGIDNCINGETKKNCEQPISSRSDFSPEESESVSVDTDSEKTIKTMAKDPAIKSRKKNPDNLARIKQYTSDKNLRQVSGSSRLSSYLESLRLIIVSLLFSANAYAQTITPTAFIDLEYSYDGVGNVTSIVDLADSQNNRSMQYDSLDRLTGANGLWGPGSFNYDPLGNRTNKNVGSSNSNYSYSPSDNRLNGYAHDANGNLLHDDNFVYEYDSENRLVAVKSGESVIAEYQYDGDGRRIKKVANGETTYYAYGTGLNVLTEFNSQGVPRYDYIYAGNKNIARVNFDANGAVESKSFYHSDHLGSSLAMTDETTTIIWNQTYLPFGEPHGGSGTIANSHQYTGKGFEEETGLYYYGARYYHSGLGRFMSVDPAPADPTDPQSWNRYAYVLNNPYKYVDPDGENPIEAITLTLDAASLGTGQLSRFVEQDSFAFYFLQGFSEDTGKVSDALGLLTARGIGKKAIAKSVSVVGKGTLWKGITNSGERLVIGRGADLKKPGALQPGEYKLEWPSKSRNNKAEWKMNSSLLRQEMRMSRPIRDASPNDETGWFLTAERNLLESQGWRFDKVTNLWMPPGGK